MHRRLHLHSVRFDISSEQLELDPWFDRLYADNDLGASLGSTAPPIPFILNVVDNDSAALRDVPSGAVFAENNLCGGRCDYADGRFIARL